MQDQMTPRERWRGAIAMQALDRLPFWPKLSASYPPWRTGAFANQNVAFFHDYIGSDKFMTLPACVQLQRSRTAQRSDCDGDRRVHFYETPVGTCRQVDQYDPASASWHPVEMPVKNREDIKIMTAFYDDVQIELDLDKLQQAEQQQRQLGETAVTCINTGTSPLMKWIEWLAGVENAHYFLYDFEAEVLALFEAMHRQTARLVEITCTHQKPDLVMMVENTSTTLISPAQFRAYCCPHLRCYTQLAHNQAIPMLLHQCGTLKELLSVIAEELPLARGTEAFTSPPVGSTRLQDGRTVLADYCLIGGTNATLWTKPAPTIIAELQKDLDVLPHHRGLVITSAGVMPPTTEPDTIREVAEFVRNYPARW